MSPRRVLLAVVLCIVLAAPIVAGGMPATTASTQADENARNSLPSGPLTTVAVAPNETVEGDVTAMGGRVIVAGTVEGTLRAYGAVIVLTEDAVVTGNAQIFAGRIVVAGEIQRHVTAYGGTVVIRGDVADLNAGGGTVKIAGETGDVTVLGGTVVLADNATVNGDLVYDARLVDHGATVTGEIRHTNALLGPVGTLLHIARWLPILLPLVGGLLGSALARTDPQTDTLAVRARDAPVRTLVLGVGVALASALAVVLVAATVVGLPLLGLLIPLALAGVVLSLAVGTRAIGGVAADRLPVTADLAGVVSAIVVAGLTVFSTVGVAVGLLLTLWGAGATVPRGTLKSTGRRLRVWT